MIRRAARTALAALLVFALASPALAVADDAIREAARRVLADPRYDKRLPDEVKVSPRANPAPRRVYRRSAPAAPREPVSSGSNASQAIMWTLLGVVGVAIILWLGREIVRARHRRHASVAPETAARDRSEADAIVAAMPATLANAHALAAAGRLDEAVRLLLRGAIDDLARLSGLAADPALTSRELLSHSALEHPSRGAFEQLVRAVEVSLFGGVPVTRTDFGRCADAFTDLHGRLLAR